jgi:Kef-type K+ transport system membrane component KefB
MKRPSDPHVDDAREGHQEGPESPEEQKVSTIVSAVFMLLVGLSMPQIAASGEMSWVELAGHVAVVTVLINVGKMFPAFVYRKEANWRERLAVALGMCPRGEVGAGIILLSLTYGISGPMVNIAILSLVLNLILTPVFIWVIVRLMEKARHESKNDEFQLST